MQPLQYAEGGVMDEKEIIEDFLKWCYVSKSVQLQEMPQYTDDYWCVNQDELINEYLEKDNDQVQKK